MLEVLKAAQYPTGVRDALVVPLHEKVCAVLAVPENADPLQGCGHCGAQFLSCVVNEIKGRPWLGLQWLTRAVWSLVAVVLPGGCQGRSCKGGWRRLSSPLFSLWRCTARGPGLCGCCSWLELSCARCCRSRVQGCGGGLQGCQGSLLCVGPQEVSVQAGYYLLFALEHLCDEFASSACLSTIFARDLALSTVSNSAWINDPEGLSVVQRRSIRRTCTPSAKGAHRRTCVGLGPTMSCLQIERRQ